MQTIAVIDFETTGISPGQGARATEIAAVLVRGGQIVGRYQSLMNSGAWVSPFIEQLTGISNEMLDDAPDAKLVMREVAEFTRGCPLVAHNASFDRGFWQAELERTECEPDPAHQFACTVLLARRLYPEAPSCKLGTLARFHALPDTGRAHRALADAELTAHLLLRMQGDLRTRFSIDLHGVEIEHGLLTELQRAAKPKLAQCVQGWAKRQRAALQASERSPRLSKKY
ncbi:MAG TPA: 3'-5' exonuclease [Burkholderiaceae bacterium]